MTQSTYSQSYSSDDIRKTEEQDTIVDVLVQKKMFTNMDLRALIHEQCFINLKQSERLAEAVSQCAVLIKPKNEDMVFSVAVDIVLIDGSISPKLSNI